MTEQNTTLTQEEEEFKAKFKAAWEEIRHFRKIAKDYREIGEEADPQHRLAPEFFQIYLDKKPSQVATEALKSAFAMWSNVRASGKIKEGLRYIRYQEDVWEGIVPSLMQSFYNDGREEEKIPFLENLVQQVVPLKSRSSLQYSLAQEWMEKGEVEKSRQGFEQIIEWNAAEWFVEHAKGYLYEFDNLNKGQPAPHFVVQDVKSNPIDLEAYRGRILVMHFWSTDCGACHMIYPHLRKIDQDYSKDDLALIGASGDTDFDALRVKIKEEGFTWPQICEGNGWKDTVFKLYNVVSIPAVYILDGTGDIACKLVGGDRGEELEEAVRYLVT